MLRFISAKQFGILLRKSQDQNFIFKISRPLYSLDFKATSVSDITIPPDFANASYIKNYLRDTCYMQEKTGTTPSDLIISLHSQVFKYDYDETEEVSLKVSCQITVEDFQSILPDQSRNHRGENVMNGIWTFHTVFFWEANVKISIKINTETQTHRSQVFRTCSYSLKHPHLGAGEIKERAMLRR